MTAKRKQDLWLIGVGLLVGFVLTMVTELARGAELVTFWTDAKKAEAVAVVVADYTRVIANRGQGSPYPAGEQPVDFLPDFFPPATELIEPASLIPAAIDVRRVKGKARRTLQAAIVDCQWQYDGLLAETQRYAMTNAEWQTATDAETYWRLAYESRPPTEPQFGNLYWCWMHAKTVASIRRYAWERESGNAQQPGDYSYWLAEFTACSGLSIATQATTQSVLKVNP